MKPFAKSILTVVVLGLFAVGTQVQAGTPTSGKGGTPKKVPAKFQPGDINMNKEIDKGDLELLQDYLSGTSGQVAPLALYDVNSDLNIDVVDITALAQLLFGSGDDDATDDILVGDLNLDGVINEKDLILLGEYIFGVAKIAAPKEAADFDGNGVINLKDLQALVDFYYGVGGPSDEIVGKPGHNPVPKLPSPKPTKPVTPGKTKNPTKI
ncbi:MAG TPA: hypothetical protein EYN79_10370 [Planctomycetes bacterium]|nr:hypothetical protein [Planctomycetota bacterium]HIN80454.1 hypothetical protein [Planctomycetota bacterium]